MQPIGVPSGNEVSLGAYLDHLHSGELYRQQDAVLVVLALADEPLTRHEIAERGGMALSAACGRVGSLKDAKFVEQAGTKLVPGARSARSTLRLTERGRVEADDILRRARS
ncbi:hypothetical protein R6258_07765 [Halomonas sp. HP20-15]|uniref:hypothetical protein n=1 Tax=Halomonas sp. HP20-15 TaxID=3085901 RepID=UPI00298243D3|nr:hypothetical protein [Halomonas sp. HP20-15]MDW5376816.1 hypothetical protein [Halomonas sp. HP20-15]